MLMIPQQKHPSPWYNTDESFGTFIPGAPNDFFSVKFVGRSKYCLEISQTWERLACSYILFFIVERAYENRNRGDLLPASEYWEFFLVVRGTQTIHFPPRKFVAPALLWSPQRLFRWARLTNPAVECSGAKPNSTNINPAKRTTFGTVLLSKKVKRTNMLQYKH